MPNTALSCPCLPSFLPSVSCSVHLVFFRATARRLGTDPLRSHRTGAPNSEEGLSRVFSFRRCSTLYTLVHRTAHYGTVPVQSLHFVNAASCDRLHFRSKKSNVNRAGSSCGPPGSVAVGYVAHANVQQHHASLPSDPMILETAHYSIMQGPAATIRGHPRAEAGHPQRLKLTHLRVERFTAYPPTYDTLKSYPATCPAHNLVNYPPA